MREVQIESLLPNAPPLYWHQALGLDYLRRETVEKPNANICVIAPTGAGKSRVMLERLIELPASFLLSPSLEVMGGYLDKLGVPAVHDLSQADFEEFCLEHRMGTPIGVRNKLARGTLTPPLRWLIDECHHASMETVQLIRAMCPAPMEGYTATAYRGSARETVEWDKLWDDQVTLITYPEAAADGIISIPKCVIWPLADDDLAVVKNGEIEVASANELVISRMDDLVSKCQAFVRDHKWDRATVFAMPGTESAREIADRLNAKHMPAALLVAGTPYAERQRILQACTRGELAIVQINVLTEGVDFTFRRLIDAAPTMSPVKAMQRWGRVMRPCDEQPELICCCRNFERHLYLLQGCVPPSVVREAQEAFGQTSKRTGSRIVGLEALGRFKATELPLSGGLKGTMYCLQQLNGYEVKQWALLLHPCSPEPIVACRSNHRLPQETKYGKWKLADSLPDFDGYASVQAGTMTPKQAAWWARSAHWHGLDNKAAPNKRSFAALPVLADLKLKLEA